MYTNYNIPQKSCCKPENLYSPQNFITKTNYIPHSYRINNYGTATYSNDGDRFIGGGVGGYLLGRPNYGNFGPGPIPVYFPPGPPPMPYPPYSNTNIYY